MKSLFESKTFWLAIVQAVGGGLVIFFTQMDMIGAVAVVKSIIDIVLRIVTTKEIG